MKTNQKKTKSGKRKTLRTQARRPRQKPLSRVKETTKERSPNTQKERRITANSAKENIQEDKAASNRYLEELKTKYKNLENQYQFLQAEYANYKKQTFKQFEELRKYDGQGIIQTLIHNVKDNFERALEVDVTEASIKEFKKGVQMIYTNFQKILTEAGVKELNCKGELFDPTRHTALGSDFSDTVPVDHIVQVIKKAYLFRDKVIRPAEVIVSNGKKHSVKEDSSE